VAAPSVLLLLSGGIDSPVAAHALQEQGARVVPVHFSQEPFTDGAAQAKARDQADHLDLEPPPVAPAGPALGTLARECDHGLYFVLQKRLMIRAADALAGEHGLDVLATGENMGQVSSQTLQNLRVVDEAADRPVVRPLVGWNKQEIVDRARSIGTYEIAEGPELCDQLGPDHPSTAATLEEVEAQEARVDVAGLVDEVVEGTREAAPSRRAAG
jgi:thiamine biosynthesis protein ThiI